METKKLRNGGFTLLETLLTVAILVILLGVSAVGAVYYRDYLEITELDNAARDIYMAAENRAVLLQNSGASVALLSAEGGGSGGTVTLSSAGDEAKLADLLPTGTIDPALWKGDFRIIYDQATGHVKEVFYAEAEKETIPNDLEHLEQFRGTRAARVALFRSGGTLVGYYGSEVGEAIGTKPLPTPGVEVFIENGEELTLTVRYTLPEGLPAGVTATPSIKLYYPTGSTTPIKSLEPVLTFSGNTATYEMVLDSLESGKQFKDLKSGLFSGLTDLGGDFTVNAGLTLAVPTDPEWIDSAYYATGSDNSLFAKGSTYNTAGGTAKIANLRHLQNLCANFSEVGDGITKAEQTADIDCRGAEEPPDTRYEFIPIENTNLTSYIGKYSGKDGDVNTHINNLYVKQGVAAAGLFGKVTSGLEITDCRVCWTRPKALVGGTDYVYAVSGTNAGGLIGAVTGGTVKIENSFAATTVQGDGKSGKSGGLVGTQTGGTLTIKNSYADCYLSGTNAGGLVGSKTGGTLKIDRSYAAGFIVDGTTTAGLVNGSVDTATHCYSVVRVIQKDTDGKETLVEPATRMYTDWDKDPGSAFYLSSPADVTEDQLGNAFEYTNADNSPETHVYNLRHKLDNTVETLMPPYPFPGLKDTDGTAMPHYGDWAKQDSIPAGLVYYEFYKDRTTDVWGVFEDLEDLEDKKIGIGVCGVLENGDALEDLENDNITKDGYALVFEGKNAPGNYTIKYGNEGSIQTWTLEGSPISVDVGGKTYTLLPLPDDIVTGKLSEDRPEAPEGATAKFYQQLTCGTGADMRTYWFNPHFAKTVETTKPADLNLPVTSIIFVRTPRHFYDLSNYQNNYVNSKGYSFLQELDLDYGSYKGYPGIFEPKEGELPFKQLPIGQGSSTNVSFRGTYDGGCHKIKNVFFISTNNEYRYLGLFGWVNKSNGISLKNIVYELDPNRVETVTYYEAAQSFGTLVGTLQQGTMTNCAVYGVNMSITGHALDCGGLVGTNNGTITGCSSELVSLTVDKSWAGGLVGSSGGIVENSYAVGKIVVTGAGASGLVNETKDGTVTNCYAAVSLTATDQIRGLSNISSNVENSGFLVGTFKYRGEEYTVDNTYQADDGKGAGKRITPAKLAETVTLDPVNNNTVKNIPAGATYAKDYGGEFPYLTGVTDGDGPVHYGLWPVEKTEAPPVGLAYYERYDSNNKEYGLEGVYEDVKFEMDDKNVKPIYLDGYALVVLEEGYDESAPIEYTVTYGGESWTWKRNNAKWDNPLSAEVQLDFTVKQDNKTYHVFPLPDEVFTEAPANADSFYQELKISRSGVAASQTFYFNPHFAKTVHKGGETAPSSPTDVNHQVYVRTPRHLYDLSVYSDTYAPMGLYYGQELDLDYNKTYSWEYDMKPTWNDKDSVYEQAPIGTNVDHSFTGTYDGGTHTIQNVVYRYPTDGEKRSYFGLFGCAATATLTDVHYKTGGQTVQNAGIPDSDTYVGMLAGHAATVASCTVEVSGSLTVEGTGKTLFAGGLAGCADKIEGECSANLDQDLTVKGTGYAVNAGGLVGYSGQSLTGCTAKVGGAVTVSGTGQDIFGGGLVGRVMDNKVVVSDCHATIGTLSVSGPGAYTYGGGLTGYAGTIEECTATITGESLTVTGTGDAANAYGGGLTGGTGGSSTTIIWDESGQPKRDENGNIMYVANWVKSCSVVAKDAALTVTAEGGVKGVSIMNDEGKVVRDDYDGSEAYGGGLVGRTYGTVSDCGVVVKSLEVKGQGKLAYGGGLAGYADKMEKCKKTSISSVTVTGTAPKTVIGPSTNEPIAAGTNAYGGGLAGQPYWGVTECTIENSELTVTVSGTGKDIYGGGLAGRVWETAEVSGCSAQIKSLEVTGKDLATYTYGGGLVGSTGLITGCDAVVYTIKVMATGEYAGAYGGGLAGEVHHAGWSTGSCTAKTGTLTVERTGGIAGQSQEYNAYAGGLVARALGRIDNCTAETDVLSVTGNGVLVYGGGLAGSATQTVYGCDATVTKKITAEGTGTDTRTYGAGLVAYTASSLENCAAEVGAMAVTGAGDATYGAGLVCQPGGGVVKSTALVESMTVKGTKAAVEEIKPTTAAGGLAAYTSSPLTNCAAGVGTLTVDGAGDATYGAGLAGHASGGVTSCEAATDTLTVSGSGTYTYAGGLVGSSVTGNITLSYAMGRISKETKKVDYVGGLVGYSMGKITNCYAAVDVPKIGLYRGGLVGQLLDTSFKQNLGGIDNSYWLKGAFKYRGETYSMPGNDTNFTDANPKYATTRGELLSKIPGMKSWVNISKPADDFPALGSSGYENWMADYKNQGISGYYPGIVEDRNWKIVHYGLWPIEDKTGRSRNLEYAAESALPDAALPEPAAQPAEPEPKPKDESDPTP